MNCARYRSSLGTIDQLSTATVVQMTEHSRDCMACRRLLYEARKRAQIEWVDRRIPISFNLDFIFGQLMETSR